MTFTSENGLRDYDESKGIIAYYPPVAIDEVIGVPATREISFIGDGQVNAAKVPLVGVAADEVSPDGSLRMSFSNICSVIEFRVDAGDVAEGIRTFKVEPASETGFEGYLSFTGTVDPETLAISPATTGNSITLTLPDGASLNRPLTLKVPVGRFTSHSGLKLTVESPFGTSDSRVVYATGIQSYSVEDGIYSVKHFAKPLYPFSTLVVDLGLSVLWGTCNLGTTTVWEKGGSYVWQGWTTDLGKLGANWRMPTISEFDELRLNCSWERFSIQRVPRKK